MRSKSWGVFNCMSRGGGGVEGIIDEKHVLSNPQINHLLCVSPHIQKMPPTASSNLL